MTVQIPVDFSVYLLQIYYIYIYMEIYYSVNFMRKKYTQNK